MEELQQALRGKAETAMNLLHQGICKTEQKLEQCLQVLASVQEEVLQHQEAQACAIQEDYNQKLQELTEIFEQQVLLLQQQTQQQLAELQTASEDALQQAAQLLLQELQLDSPAIATPLRPSSGSRAGSDVALELSLAALQQHADATYELHQHTAAGCDWYHEMQQRQEEVQEPTFSPSQPGESVTGQLVNPGWPAQYGADSVDAQHSSACSSRASSRCKKPAGAVAASALGCHPLQGATASQHQAPDDTGPGQDVADTLWVPVQDQVVPKSVPEPAQQRYAEQAAECVQQQQQQQEQGQQPHPVQQQQGHVHQQRQDVEQHHEDCISSHEPATDPKPARTASSAQAAGCTAAASAAVAGELARPTHPLDPESRSQQRPGQRSTRSSSSSHGYSMQDVIWPRGKPARRSCENAHHSPAFATPTDTPYRTQPWRPIGDVPTHGRQGEQQQHHHQQQQRLWQQQQQKGEEHRHTRQLKTLSSLPARWQPSLQSQPALRRCVSHVGDAQAPSAAVLLKSAPNLRQQLEAGWQQGLAKAAGKAAASSLLDPHAVTAAEKRLSKMHSRKVSLTANLDSSSSSDSDDGGTSPTRSPSRSPSRRQPSRSPSARHSSKEGRGTWQKLLQEAQGQQQGGGGGGVFPQGGGGGGGGGAKKSAAVHGSSGGSRGRRPGALSRSSSAATGRLVGSLALDLLD